MEEERLPLHRDSQRGIIFGVAAGLAESFNVDPTLVRIGFVLLLFVSGGAPAILLYLVLALLLPDRSYAEAAPREVVQQNIGEMKTRMGSVMSGVKDKVNSRRS
jgi:phage shock protein C